VIGELPSIPLYPNEDPTTREDTAGLKSLIRLWLQYPESAYSSEILFGIAARTHTIKKWPQALPSYREVIDEARRRFWNSFVVSDVSYAILHWIVPYSISLLQVKDRAQFEREAYAWLAEKYGPQTKLGLYAKGKVIQLRK
jgi:hypothetical protein